MTKRQLPIRSSSSTFSDMAESPLSMALRPLPVDGRQSPVALHVQRGVRRLFAQLGHVTLPEFSLANGRRADVIALAPDGCVTIVEIKSCAVDFRTDRKWLDYKDFCDLFYFAVPETMGHEILPADRGLILADAFGAAFVREAERHPLSGSRRKALTLRFARAAAGRLGLLAGIGEISDGAL